LRLWLNWTGAALQCLTAPPIHFVQESVDIAAPASHWLIVAVASSSPGGAHSVIVVLFPIAQEVTDDEEEYKKDRYQQFPTHQSFLICSGEENKECRIKI
jgi:hypothetical protein